VSVSSCGGLILYTAAYHIRGGGGLYSEVCRSGLDLTSAKIKGPSTNQMRLIYPINQSDVY
jgi:hypothetical protein